MSGQLIECIPNFSEARRPEVIKEITHAIQSIPNVQILDLHSDKDHNRTVVTYIGSPKDVEEAAFQAIKKASELINMEQHTGSHPRLGATDVVPFVPISGVSMDDCINIAHHLAKRVGSELQIPVYLYEEAALKPERKNLEKIRRGEYELLKNEIITNDVRTPDFGPRILTSAGATVIGARNPLIAFNVYLDSGDLLKARSIAQAIRESSGGLPSVKALGMMVNGLAQVSMNLTNFRRTSIFQVIEAIRIQATKLNTTIHHSELVGLIPQDALVDTAITYLQLDGFEEDQILERRLFTAGSGQNTVNFSILDEFASSRPTPGGGSAAAYTGAMAAALVSMVARLTIGKKKYSSVEAQMQEILLQSEKIRSQLKDYVQQDAQAFERVMAAFKLPNESSELETARMHAIEDATRYAAQIPMQVAQWSVMILALSERTAVLGNINAISDAGSAGALAMASIKSASYNVRINLANLTNEVTIESMQTQIEQLEKRAANIERQLLKSIKERGGI
ncbi:MAG: glutamate formimidoyltransferase [Chloroflexi bacterium GWB2_49_20]|nr:MAG: glutamate formimidoyltransferase [Chloroflexi bacterium GWB2_49_20]OGN80054.1 MAG: glutamate formimidoyltransferase [Chloroflexi bacterium GWC2_49_37]OGN85410.1 MAG: glutamate formimidoyltransferase [Chloroflexi bacterium GWD2_49_16]HCM97120.1 glutamate formimidoyltransferase [Anaerolineae bacterium]